jgi:hypothetical protein
MAISNEEQMAHGDVRTASNHLLARGQDLESHERVCFKVLYEVRVTLIKALVRHHKVTIACRCTYMYADHCFQHDAWIDQSNLNPGFVINFVLFNAPSRKPK